MKRKWLCIFIAFAVFTAPALSELSFDGRVISSQTLTVMAPFGGIIDEVYLRKGDSVHVGDAVAAIQTTRVYAPVDGVIGGVFAREGDDVDGIISRYGGILYLEPTNRYIISANTEKAYNSSSTRYVHIGEEVYLSCTKDGSHTGTAIVTKVEDLDSDGNTPYSLEVTSGNFYIGETVGIYRTKNHRSSSRIGRGTVHQNSAIAITGAGSDSGSQNNNSSNASVLKLHVKEGDRVERGEMLFETVEGALDGLFAMDNVILSGSDGIVASVDVSQGSRVEKNGKLISVYPRDAMQIEMYVSEMDLPEIREGDAVSIEFEWDVDAAMLLSGTISGISRVGADNADGSQETRYSAYVDFDPVDAVSMDMSVIVHLLNSEEDADHAGDEPGEDADDGDEADAEEPDGDGFAGESRDGFDGRANPSSGSQDPAGGGRVRKGGSQNAQ